MSVPELDLVSTATGKIYRITEAAANQIKITNVSDGKDLLVIDSTTVTDASGVKLASHADRHGYGGADPLPAGSIDRSQLKPLGFLWVRTASPTPGTGGAYGAAVALTPAANKSIVPLFIKLSWGGTFAAGETVTIRITVKFSDGTTAVYTKSATATGDYWLTDAEKASLMKDGVYITEIDVDASSSAASTSVTTTVTIYALEI
jgi:hypothetical protein